jgi:orotidine-5'-phosphate decarboxylase
MTPECGLLVNSSRGIIFASGGEDYADAAGDAAKKLAEEMGGMLNTYSKI